MKHLQRTLHSSYSHVAAALISFLALSNTGTRILHVPGVSSSSFCTTPHHHNKHKYNRYTIQEQRQLWQQQHHQQQQLKLNHPLHMMIQGKKQILQPHHAQEIIQTSNGNNNDNAYYDDAEQLQVSQSQSQSYSTIIFHEFVKTVCSTSCIPRKEMYEAWSSACVIHETFPKEKRIADLACGHGLLSWSLLLLDMIESNKCSKCTSGNIDSHDDSRTAVCIDRRMPKSAEKIADAMINRWPQLRDKWDFVECKLESIVPSSTTLLCGVHACGILTDKIITLAMEENAPVALVPCCHAKKSMNRNEKLEFDRIQQKQNKMNGYGSCSIAVDDISDDDDNTDAKTNISLGDYIDNLRIKRLQSSGYFVTQTEIPKEYTPQNKVILASPTISSSSSRTTKQKQNCNSPIQNDENSNTNSNVNKKRIRHPQYSSYPGGVALVPVPIGNDEESIQAIKSLSGRIAADKRKLPKPPSLCVSIFMSQSDTITPRSLLSFVDQIWGSANDNVDQHDYDDHSNKNAKVTCTVDYADDGPYLHPNGLYARTFCITYEKENTNTAIGKERAKQLHEEFCEKIPYFIEGIQVRR